MCFISSAHTALEYNKPVSVGKLLIICNLLLLVQMQLFPLIKSDLNHQNHPLRCLFENRAKNKSFKWPLSFVMLLYTLGTSPSTSPLIWENK